MKITLIRAKIWRRFLHQYKSGKFCYSWVRDPLIYRQKFHRFTTLNVVLLLDFLQEFYTFTVGNYYIYSWKLLLLYSRNTTLLINIYCHCTTTNRWRGIDYRQDYYYLLLCLRWVFTTPLVSQWGWLSSWNWEEAHPCTLPHKSPHPIAERCDVRVVEH